MCWDSLYFVFGTGGIFFGRARCPELTPERAGVGLVMARVVRVRVLFNVDFQTQIDPIDDLYNYQGDLEDEGPKELGGEEQRFSNPFEGALTERVRGAKPYRKFTGPVCVVLDGMFARALWFDGLYDEFAAEASGRADIHLFPSMLFGFSISGVAVVGDLVSGILVRHWEEGPGPAT